MFVINVLVWFMFFETHKRTLKDSAKFYRDVVNAREICKTIGDETRCQNK